MLVGNEHIYRDQNQLKAMLADAINKVPRIYQYGNEKYDWEVIYDQSKFLRKGPSPNILISQSLISISAHASIRS